MNASISYIRVLAMLIVVFCHCLFYYGIWTQFSDAISFCGIEYWRTLGLIAVNAFVFISGYLFAFLYIKKGKYRNNISFFKKKTLRILIPYCFWGIIAMLLFPGKQPIKDFFCGIQHLWFLLMLFGVFTIAKMVINRFIKLNKRQQIGIFLSLLVVNQIVSKCVSPSWNYLAWMQVLKYLPAFFVGIMMVLQGWENEIRKWKTCWFYIALAASVGLVIIMAIVPSWPFGLLYMNLPTYALFVFFFILLEKKQLNTNSKIIQSIDKCSLGIYIIHHLFIWAILIYIPECHNYMNEHYIISPLIMFFFVLLGSWGITILLGVNKYTRIIIGA